MDSLRLALSQAIEKALQYHRTGQFEEAEAIYKYILTVDPEYFDSLHLLGVLARQTGRSDSAIELISKALLINDKEPAAFNNLGVAYLENGRPYEAEKCYRQAVYLKPDYAEAYFNLGIALMKTSRHPDAEISYRKAIEIKSDYVEAYNNLGSTLRKLGKPEDAVTAYMEAIHLKPSAEIYGNLGSTFRELSKPESAEAAFREAIILNPDFMEAHHHLSVVHLLQGKYEEGFERYEKRFEVGAGKYYKKTVLSQFSRFRRWNGESIAGSSLLVITEQGNGDNIMMMRYLPLLKKLNLKRLIVCCHHPSIKRSLKRLLEAVSGVDNVVSLVEASSIGEFDMYCPMMSLPYLFHTRIETIPDNVPYLSVPEDMKKIWINRLASVQGIKVGLVWAGRNMNYIDKIRSIPLGSFAPLMKISGVSFVSLQKGEQSLQIKKLNWNIADWMGECTDFLDTAALVNELDLVISVDTAVAHLAGGLGKHVWLLNRFASEWRWLLNKKNSPWYPSMKIYQQNDYGDWDSVISLLFDELQHIDLD